MGKEFIKTSQAEVLLGRGPRRIQQLIKEGVLEGGQFFGSVSLASVLKYKRGIDSGEIRRGPKGKQKTNGKLK
jgi:hypothetical protein